MNPCLILTCNNLELTKKCVESVRGQDIPTNIHIIDNASTDGTKEAFPRWNGPQSNPIMTWNEENKGVSQPWNEGLDYWFRLRNADHVLVLNNDAIIPPWFYRQLLAQPYPFVTGIAVDSMEDAFRSGVEIGKGVPHPDFSAFLIRKECWAKVGKFDERMKIYASDTDYHVRGHRAGVEMMKVNLPYYHVNSQTLKRANPSDREAIQSQANKDREVFKELYGCLPGTPEYQELFK
jgi:GT2 family glycosyltransferase